MTTRRIRLVEVAAILLATAGAFEIGVAMRRILVGFILVGLIVVVAAFVVTVLEKRRKKNEGSSKGDE